MSITVSCEFRVREGHVDAVIRQTVEHLAIPAPGRRHPRLYQHLDDATRLLYIGDWESRRAFENFRLTTSMPSSWTPSRPSQSAASTSGSPCLNTSFTLPVWRTQTSSRGRLSHMPSAASCC
ncbi:MAG: putative quinol monooxygenase [Chloroflexota bacterium]